MNWQLRIGRNIAKLRHDKNMTQKELANSIGISVRHLRRIEDGEILHPNVKVLVRIAYVLGVTINELEKE